MNDENSNAENPANDKEATRQLAAYSDHHQGEIQTLRNLVGNSKKPSLIERISDPEARKRYSDHKENQHTMQMAVIKQDLASGMLHLAQEKKADAVTLCGSYIVFLRGTLDTLSSAYLSGMRKFDSAMYAEYRDSVVDRDDIVSTTFSDIDKMKASIEACTNEAEREYRTKLLDEELPKMLGTAESLVKKHVDRVAEACKFLEDEVVQEWEQLRKALDQFRSQNGLPEGPEKTMKPAHDVVLQS